MTLSLADAIKMARGTQRFDDNTPFHDGYVDALDSIPLHLKVRPYEIFDYLEGEIERCQLLEVNSHASGFVAALSDVQYFMQYGDI